MADIDDWILPDRADLLGNLDHIVDAAIRDVLPPAFHDTECCRQVGSFPARWEFEVCGTGSPGRPREASTVVGALIAQSLR